MRTSLLRNGLIFSLLWSTAGCTANEGAVNGGGTSQISVVAFSAAPGVISPGQSSTLHWSTKGARSVTILVGDEVLLEESTDLVGSFEVQPGFTSSYELVARAPGKEARASAEVVVGIEILRFVARLAPGAPAPSPGQPASLHWEVAGAQELEISNGGDFRRTIVGAEVAEGSHEAPIPAEGEVFRLVAISGDQRLEATIEPDAIEPGLPSIEAFTAGTTIITAGLENRIPISWKVHGAESLRLLQDDVALDLGDRSWEEDTIEIVVSTATTLRLEASNEAGEVGQELAITEVPEPRIRSLRALPRRVEAGESYSVEWATENATIVSLQEIGGETLGDLQPVGSIEHSASADTHWVLVAMNDAGTLVEGEVSITIGAPIVREFGFESGRVAPGAAVSLSWSCDGGTSLQIFDGSGGAVAGCGTADVAEVADGSCSFDAPLSAGLYEYELVVSTPTQSARSAASLIVSDGPFISHFEAEPGEAFVGDSVLISWRVEPDLFGMVPTLSLTDDQGLPLEGLLDGDEFEGSMVVTLDRPGLHRFHLEASTPGTIPAFAAREVIALRGASVSLRATPEAIDLDVGEEAELSWTTEEAITLTVWALDDAGAPIQPPLIESSDPQLVASGSTTVSPWHTTTYLARVVDVRGVEAFEELVIPVLLVEIERFEADPPAVVEGESTKLTWTTKRADSVSLDYAADFTFKQSTKAMIELEKPSELELEGDCGFAKGNPLEDACPQLTIEGFTFPWGNGLFDRMRVSVHGFVTFDEGEFGYTQESAPLPPMRMEIDTLIAPLWDNLLARQGVSKILYGPGEEAGRGKYFVVSWVDFFLRGIRDPNECDARRTFQLVLWEDGAFDFRYGNIENAAGIRGCERRPVPSVGYVAWENSAQLFYDAEPPAGFTGISIEFSPFEIDVNVSLLPVVVPHTRTFTLTAYGARGSVASRTITVQAAPQASFTLVRTDGMAEVGKPLSVVWQTENATAVEVRDPEGGVVCAMGTVDPLFGACEIVWSQLGPADFEVRAVNGVGYETVHRVSLDFTAPFEVTLQATPDHFRPGDELKTTLRWTSENASKLTLFRDGKLLEELPPAEFASGSRIFEMDRSHSYLIRATKTGSSFIKEREVRVEIEWVELQKLEASVSQVELGEEVTFSWEATLRGSEPLFVESTPSIEMREVAGPDHAFDDISAIGTPIPGFAENPNGSNLSTLSLPFSFPYYGETYDELWVGSMGFITFTPTVAWGVVHPLLSWIAFMEERPHLAPYYARLRPYSKGRGFSLHRPDPTNPARDCFLLQWDTMQLQVSSAPPVAEQNDDLTFQVALCRDGSFEYRYGRMSSPNDPDGSRGKGAAVGYRSPGINLINTGHELFYNPPNPVTLEGRTWRYQAPGARDELTVAPTESKVYELCFEQQGNRICEAVPVAVLKQGELVITELHLDPVGTQGGQWFEVRNLGVAPIQLEGFRVESSSGSSTVTGSAVVDAGGFAVLSPDGPTFPAGLSVARYDGEAVFLGDGEDHLRLLSPKGTLLAEVSWDSSWTFPTDGSLGLDPIHHLPQTIDVDRFDLWCASAGVGSPGSGNSCASRYYDFDPFSSERFIDISSTGINLFPRKSQSPETFAFPGGLGFEMPFFGETTSNVWASLNGFASFRNAPDPRRGNEALPTGWTTGLVAPFWDAFIRQFDVLGEYSLVSYERRTVDGLATFILQWTDLRRHTTSAGNEWPGSATFQLQLRENGDIVFAYGPLLGNDRHFGSNATVGLESLDGKEAIEILYNRALLRPGQVLKFSYRP